MAANLGDFVDRHWKKRHNNQRKNIGLIFALPLNVIELSTKINYGTYIFSILSYRVGQRGTGLSATIARSEHEISEIIDGLSEQEVSVYAEHLFVQKMAEIPVISYLFFS